MKYIFISFQKKISIFDSDLMHLFDLCVCVCVCIRRNKIQFRLYYQYKVHTLFSCPLAIVNWNDFSQSSSSSSSLIFQCEKSFNFLLSDHFNHFFLFWCFFLYFHFQFHFLSKLFLQCIYLSNFKSIYTIEKEKKIIVSLESIHQRRWRWRLSSIAPKKKMLALSQ